MFIKLKRSESNKVISLQGKSLDIIRLPQSPGQQNSSFFTVALVVIHDISKHPNTILDALDISKISTIKTYSEIPEEYWNSFTILAKSEANNQAVFSGLLPLFDKICMSIKDGMYLFDLENEKTYFDINETLEMYYDQQIIKDR